MSIEKHPLQIKNPELQISEDVQNAVEVHERQAIARNKELRKNNQEGPFEIERVPNNPNDRLDVYMERLENIFLNPDTETRDRNLNLVRHKLYDSLLIKPEVAAEQILKDEAKIAEARGYGRYEVTDDMIQNKEVLNQAAATIQRQKESLNGWIDYLTSSDTSMYDPWFKYYLFTNITKLQSLVKTEKTDTKTGVKVITAEYPKRSASTLKSFPDIYRGKLAQIYDKYNQFLKGEKNDKATREYFQKNFAKVYAEESLDQIVNASKEISEETKGEWVKFSKGNIEDADRIVESLKDKYTDWCIEGRDTARSHIEQGDIHIYYTSDKSGKLTNPRLCIRMEGERIAEVRGVSGGKNQEVEQVFMDDGGEGGNILGGKLKEFGSEAIQYQKKEGDMKYITKLIKKRDKREQFNREDLIFLYETESQIEGFGYGKDPRIDRLLSDRDMDADMLTVLGCRADQVAHEEAGVNESTAAYVGPLFPGMFEKLRGIREIYTSFPSGKIVQKDLLVGTETLDELVEKFKAIGIGLGHRHGEYLFGGKDYIINRKPELIKTVRISTDSLQLPEDSSIQDIYSYAQALGLDLCPKISSYYYFLLPENNRLNEHYVTNIACEGSDQYNPYGYVTFGGEQGVKSIRFGSQDEKGRFPQGTRTYLVFIQNEFDQDATSDLDKEDDRSSGLEKVFDKKYHGAKY